MQIEAEYLFRILATGKYLTTSGLTVVDAPLQCNWNFGALSCTALVLSLE